MFIIILALLLSLCTLSPPTNTSRLIRIHNLIHYICNYDHNITILPLSTHQCILLYLSILPYISHINLTLLCLVPFVITKDINSLTQWHVSCHHILVSLITDIIPFPCSIYYYIYPLDHTTC